MVKTTFLILIVIGTYLAADCGPKCGICNTDGENHSCVYCIASVHTMSSPINGTCTGTSTGIPNCVASFATVQGAHCFLCEDGFGAYSYLDNNGKYAGDGKCYQLPESGIWGEWRNSPMEIYELTCEEGFMPANLGAAPSNNVCVPANHEDYAHIDNCLGRDANTTCHTCGAGYS